MNKRAYKIYKIIGRIRPDSIGQIVDDDSQHLGASLIGLYNKMLLTPSCVTRGVYIDCIRDRINRMWNYLG
jgi:hypothetical protein